MRLIYELKTANLFMGQESQAALMEDFSDFKWPPYHKVSSYDPFEDDPRLAIKCLEFCPYSRTLSVGGNAGQVITFSLNPSPAETSLKVCLYVAVWWYICLSVCHFIASLMLEPRLDLKLQIEP